MEWYSLVSCCLLTLVSVAVILSATELRDTDHYRLPRHAPKRKAPGKRAPQVPHAKPQKRHHPKPHPKPHHPKPHHPKPPPHHTRPPPHSHHSHKHTHSPHAHHTKPTHIPPCQPVNCVVKQWSRWGRCSVPCGTKGTQERTRQVTSNAACGGTCPYELRETRRCNYYCINGGTLHENHCHCFENFGGYCCEDVHGHWGCWEDWSPCSVTCGPGTRQRRRTCTYPPPANDGRECTGINAESTPCKVTEC